MIIPSFFPLIGGAEAQVRRLSSGLRERGWDVRILTRRDPGTSGQRLAREVIVDGVQAVRISSRGPGKIASLRYLVGGLWVLARAGRGQIYHAHDIGTAGLLALLARRLLGGRSIVKLRTGASVYRARLDRGISRLVFRSLLRRHDRIVVVNSEVREWAIGFGIPSARVVKIPNAVDGEVYRKPTATERREARIALGLPLDRTVVLSVGRLVRVKGLDLLLSAWSMLPEGVRGGALLVIVGDGPARPALSGLIGSRGIDGSVRLMGTRSDVTECYRAADVFVLPSRSEGLSNALLEAMASELPVLATAVGGATDVVQDRVNGFLVAPDENDLMLGLQRLLSHSLDWPAMGMAGRKAAIEYAGIEVILDTLENAYGGLCSDRTAPHW